MYTHLNMSNFKQFNEENRRKGAILRRPLSRQLLKGEGPAHAEKCKKLNQPLNPMFNGLCKRVFCGFQTSTKIKTLVNMFCPYSLPHSVQPQLANNTNSALQFATKSFSTDVPTRTSGAKSFPTSSAMLQPMKFAFTICIKTWTRMRNFICCCW